MEVPNSISHNNSSVNNNNRSINNNVTPNGRSPLYPPFTQDMGARLTPTGKRMRNWTFFYEVDHKRRRVTYEWDEDACQHETHEPFIIQPTERLLAQARYNEELAHELFSDSSSSDDELEYTQPDYVFPEDDFSE